MRRPSCRNRIARHAVTLASDQGKPLVLRHEGREIPFRVIISQDRRRTRSVIKVRPGRIVELHLPHSARRVDAAALMHLHAAWVMRKLEAQEGHASPPPRQQWTEGAPFLFLGETLALTLVQSPRRHVAAEAGRLIVEGPRHAPASTQRLVSAWLKQQAEHCFTASILSQAASLPWVLATPSLSVQQMKARWGSCSSRGAIRMNTLLVKAPLDLVDYVILHELCHLKEHNHSARFYALMDQYMPDWRERRARLSALAPAILPQ